MTWTLANMRAKVRLLTARPSGNDISDDAIDTYLNNFYRDDFISLIDLDALDDWWEVQTIPGDEDISQIDTNFALVNLVYINGVAIEVYRDPGTFYDRYSQDYSVETIGTGDGATSSFSFTLQKTPVSPRNIIVDDSVETFTVSSATSTVATLEGTLGGTGSVTLATGAGSVIFNTAPTDTEQVRCTYEFFSTGRPQAALIFEDRITFRPIPDEVYAVRFRASLVPELLTDSVDILDDSWGKAVCYGASIDLANDYGQMELAEGLQIQFQRLMKRIHREEVRGYVDVRSEPTL